LSIATRYCRGDTAEEILPRRYCDEILRRDTATRNGDEKRRRETATRNGDEKRRRETATR
jgi:hypothetical protein